jgi:cytochrome d ubiquinol oxidase subunit I
MSADPILLARAQFGLNIAFHILFPTVTIALAWVLLYLRLRAVRTGEEWVNYAYRLWVKIFALSFALGVVSGITMSFQFGTNWPGFMAKAGNIAGPLLGYEILTAFFLEAGFLGVMLFGRDRVPAGSHVVGHSGGHRYHVPPSGSWRSIPGCIRPRGLHCRGRAALAADWLAIIFVGFPSADPYDDRLRTDGGVRGRRHLGASTPAQPRFWPARRSVPLGIAVAAVLAPVQIFVGDLHGLNTLQHQPAKIAAVEGIWETERGVPLMLFAWPNERERRNDYAISVPRAASLILTHDPDGEVKGLSEFGDKHPPVAPVFFTFRLMVGVGMLMLAFAWLGAWVLWWRREVPRWLLFGFAGMTFSGWVATLAGWLTTEIGRQPYLVYGVITTAETASSVPAANIALTLVGYAAVYALLLASYLLVVTQLARKEADGYPEPQLQPENWRPANV